MLYYCANGSSAYFYYFVCSSARKHILRLVITFIVESLLNYLCSSVLYYCTVHIQTCPWYMDVYLRWSARPTHFSKESQQSTSNHFDPQPWISDQKTPSTGLRRSATVRATRTAITPHLKAALPCWLCSSRVISVPQCPNTVPKTPH